MIETERLLLRKPTSTDVEDPPAFLTDPRVMDFLGGVGDDPGWVVQHWLDGWAANGAGKLIVETAAGERIGRVGLNFYDPARWVQTSSPGALPELTWGLAREHWGHGYATEAALAVREWAYRDLDCERIVSLIEPRNVRSRRVAERLGAAPGEAVELPGYGPHVVWEHPR